MFDSLIKTKADVESFNADIDLMLYQGNKEWLHRTIAWLSKIARLNELAIELNDGWVPRWHDDNAKKYYVRFDRDDRQLKVSYIFNKEKDGGYYPVFESAEAAQQAIDILMKEAEVTQ